MDVPPEVLVQLTSHHALEHADSGSGLDHDEWRLDPATCIQDKTMQIISTLMSNNQNDVGCSIGPTVVHVGAL
jgi:hypothetical protein